MPAISGADQALMRSGPPAIEYYLAIMPRVVVFACSLDDVDATYGLSTLAWDNATVGAWNIVPAGQTLEVYDSTGTTYKGKVRVRWTSALIIEVAANNDIEWADDDLLYVIDWYEPWGVQTGMADVGGSTEYYKDSDINFTTEAAAFPPNANGGVAWAGFSSDGIADVDFTAALSDAMAPGATIDTYSWDITDGSFQAGGAATAAITARFPIGFRYIHLTVTDSNAETGIHHIPVWVFGGNYQPLKYGIGDGGFEIKRRQHEVRDGELVVEVFEESIDTTEVPEGTCVCLFSITRVAGVEVTEDLGAEFSGRQPIKFLGWILEDGISYNPETGTVQFDCGSIGKVADQLPGWGTFVKDAEPADWHACTDDMTVRRAMYFLLRWQSTLCQVAHIEFIHHGDADNTSPIAGRKFTVAPPLKQIEAAMLMTRGIFARIGCTRWGSIHIRYDPQELPTADRDAVAQIMHLYKTDLYEEMEFSKSTRPRAQSVLGGGIDYDGTDGTPYRGRSPGQAPRRAGKALRMDNLIITSQNELNDVLGRYLAVESNEWDEVPLVAMWDVFEPALQEYVKIEVDAAQNPRGFTFTDVTRWVVRRIECDDGPKGPGQIQAVVELLVDGFGGVTVAIPEAPNLPRPPYPGPRPTPGPEEDFPSGKVAFAGTDYGAFYAMDIDVTTPIWLEIGSSTLLNGLDVVEIIQNPASSRNLAALIRTANYDTNQDFGDIYVIEDYRTGAWEKLLDGGDAWDEYDTIEGGGGAIDNTGAWQKIFWTSDGYLLARAKYEIGANQGITRVTRWADPINSTAHNTGDQVDISTLNNPCFAPGGSCKWFWGTVWEQFNIYERGVGTFSMIGCAQAGNYVRPISCETSDYFATYTRWEAGNNNQDADTELARYGGVMLPSGDIVTMWYDETWGDTGKEFKIMLWPSGAWPGDASSILEDFNLATINVAGSFGFRRQWMRGNGDTGWMWAIASESDPTVGPDFDYGTTDIYLNQGYPVAYQSVDLPIYGSAMESFWGGQFGAIYPQDRIIIGNKAAYDPNGGDPIGTLGPQVVYLLTSGATTVANKSGGVGATSLVGQSVTVVYDIHFDQYED